MKVVSFFDATTGVLHPRQLVTSDDTVVAKNTPVDHIVIDGHYDHLSKRVDIAALLASHTATLTAHRAYVDQLRAAFKPVVPGDVFVEPRPPALVATSSHLIDYQPPAPSSDHEWNATTRRWGLSASAQAKIDNKAAALRAIATLDAQSTRALRELALGVAGAHERLASIESQITTLRSQL